MHLLPTPKILFLFTTYNITLYKQDYNTFYVMFIIHSKVEHTFYTSIFYTIIVLKKNTFSYTFSPFEPQKCGSSFFARYARRATAALARAGSGTECPIDVRLSPTGMETIGQQYCGMSKVFVYTKTGHHT